MYAPTLTQKLLHSIEHLGRLRAPSEAVGVIVKRDVVIELPNRSITPHNSFTIRVVDISLALENLRINLTPDEWLEVVLWHTHPSGTEGPSRTDVRNKIPELTHLVVALKPDEVIPALY